MKLKLENVGAITKGEIEIVEHAFNIKYAANGTGKSTFARFLAAHLSNDADTMKRFVPFGTSYTPSISFEGGNPQKCMIFNEDYISQYLFRPNDVLNKTVDLMRLTPAVQEAIEHYNAGVSRVKQAALDPHLVEIVNKAFEMEAMCRFTETGFHGNCKMGKASRAGLNVLHSSQTETDCFQDNIESVDAADWYRWWGNGNRFIKRGCPFCGQPMPSNFSVIHDALITLFSKTDAKNNLEVRQRLSDVAADLANHAGIDAFLATTDTPNRQEKQSAISEIKTYFGIAQKINSIADLSPFDLRHRSLDKLIEYLGNCKIDLSLVHENELKASIAQYNNSLDGLIADASALQTLVRECDDRMRLALEGFKRYINAYLARCGIPYQFDIEQLDMDHVKTVLVRSETEVGSDFLSYGERNCLCLALFVIDACQNNPDLIVLDDPISSFDSGKRFAMFFSLFQGAEFTLKNKTVILLTHDITPLVDFVKRTSKGVGNTAKGWMLVNNNGTLEEKEIHAEDIDCSIMIEKRLASDSSKPLISRLIHARRYLEISGYRGPTYDVLSSLFHGKEVPDKKIAQEEYEPLSEPELRQALEEFKGLNFDGDYQTLYNQLSDEALCAEYKNSTDSYERMGIARVLLLRVKPNLEEPYAHALNAVFHIEQECLFNCAFFAEQSIPKYIVEFVDEVLKKHIRALA